MKIFGPNDEQEFFNEELRVEHGDVRGPTNQGVGRRRQSVMDVVTDHCDFVVVHQRAENVVNHFLIDGACESTTASQITNH